MAGALVGLAFVLAGSLAAAVAGFIMAVRWARTDSKALSGVERDRDKALLGKQIAEAQEQQISRELSREKAAHREQLARAKEELENARKDLRRVGGDDPAAVDARLLRVHERLSPRTDPRDHDGPGVPGERSTGGGGTAPAGDGGLP